MFYLEMDGSNPELGLTLKGYSDIDINAGRTALRKFAADFEDEEQEAIFGQSELDNLLDDDTSTHLPHSFAAKILLDKLSDISVIDTETKFVLDSTGDEFVIAHLEEIYWGDIRSKDDNPTTLGLIENFQLNAISSTVQPTASGYSEHTTLGYLATSGTEPFAHFEHASDTTIYGETVYEPFATVLSLEHPLRINFERKLIESADIPQIALPID